MATAVPARDDTRSRSLTTPLPNAFRLAPPSASVEELLRYPALFKLWLVLKGSNALVGLRNCTTNCPIAQFLQEQGIEQPEVFTVGVMYGAEHHTALAPRWVQAFVNGVDRDDDEMSVFDLAVRQSEALDALYAACQAGIEA